MTQHLIIGGGPAAINAIETIREFDGGASQITLVSDEPAYSRMVLPYYLANQIPQQQVYTADDAYFETLKVQRLIGTRVSRVDPHAKNVTLSDGQNLPFDNLLIATGSSAVIPSIPGANLPGVYPLWTLAHTEAVLQLARVKPKPELVTDSGIQVDQGIVVNDRMQTNFPFIYAGGDVAQGPDLLGDKPAIHAIQPTAVDHGRVAGANMAGQDVRYPGSLLMNIL